jgi:hypothetical protein
VQGLGAASVKPGLLAGGTSLVMQQLAGGLKYTPHSTCTRAPGAKPETLMVTRRPGVTRAGTVTRPAAGAAASAGVASNAASANAAASAPNAQ